MITVVSKRLKKGFYMMHLLSIVTPTFNRRIYLAKLMNSISRFSQASEFGCQIEHVIQDNASEDGTEALVRDYKLSASHKISYQKNSQNIGGPLNLLEAIRHASGKYYMYVGDDDLIVPEKLEMALTILRDNPDLPAYIFLSFGIPKEKYFSGVRHCSIMDCLSNYFFLTGCPGGAAVKTDVAQKILAKLGNSAFSSTIWPQTQLTYLVVHEVVKKSQQIAMPICVSILTIGDPVQSNHDALTIYTAYTYWQTWFGGLLRAAENLQKLIDNSVFTACCEDIFSSPKDQFVFNLIKQYLIFIDNDAEKIRFKDTIKAELAILPLAIQQKVKALLPYASLPRPIALVMYYFNEALKSLRENVFRPWMAARRIIRLSIEVMQLTNGHNLKKKKINSSELEIRNYAVENY